MRRSRFVFVILISVLFVASGESCGPDFAGLVFTRPHGPDAPILDFTRGQIGIPMPKWWRAYLVVAYRYLEGKPLSKAEGSSFTEFWDAEKSFGSPSEFTDEAAKRWLKARHQYAPRNSAMDQLRTYSEDQFAARWNCLASAFDTAIETLQARARHFGKESEELQQWIAGQDAVFGNCSGASGAIPPALPQAADPLLRADRAYQVAAAHFYSTNYAQAKADFEIISNDSASPWRLIAPYLAARAVLRQAGPDLDNVSDTKLMEEARQRLTEIVNDPGRKQWHRPARKLRDLVAFRLEPGKQQHRLAREIAQGGTGENFGQNVRDYTLLLDKFLDQEPDFPGIERFGEPYEKRLEQWRREQYQTRRQDRGDDLTDWLMTFQSDSKAAQQHAIAKWQATKTTPWLYLAMAKLEGKDEESAAAIRAAAEIPADSPVFIALSYQRTRLLRESGSLESAREALKQAQAKKEAISRSTANFLQDEQIVLSQSSEDFSRLLPRQPVRITNDWFEEYDNACYDVACDLTFYGAKHPAKNSPLLPQFDPAVAIMLNTRVPTEELVQIVNAKSLPDHLQRRLALAVWARAALLNQPVLAAQVGDAAIAAAPELQRFVREFAAAADIQERRFVAAFTVAHFPGLRPFVDSTFPRQSAFAEIDDYRDNWWCADVGGVPDETNYEKQWQSRTDLAPPAEPAPAFLSVEQARAAETEYKTLLELGAAEEFLPRVLIAWAKTHPQDPRVPEALHFSWRVSRYSCSQASSVDKGYNRQAFKILHKNYPQSQWTKKTRVWF